MLEHPTEMNYSVAFLRDRTDMENDQNIFIRRNFFVRAWTASSAVSELDTILTRKLVNANDEMDLMLLAIVECVITSVFEFLSGTSSRTTIEVDLILGTSIFRTGNSVLHPPPPHSRPADNKTRVEEFQSS